MVVNAPPRFFTPTPEEVEAYPGVELNVVPGKTYVVNEIGNRDTYEEALLAISYIFQRILKTGSVGQGNSHYSGHTIYLTHENEKLFTDQLPRLPKQTNITVINVKNRAATGPSKPPFRLKCARQDVVIWWLLLKRCHPKYINVLYNREGVTGLSDDGGIAPGQLGADQVLEFVVEPAEADVASGESEQQEGKVAKKKTKSSAKETTPKPTKKQKQQQKLQQQLQRRQLQQQQRQKDFQQQQHLEIEISQLMQSVQQPQQIPQQQSVQQLQPQQPPQQPPPQPQPQQSQQQQQQLQQLQQQRDTMSRLIQLMQKHKVQQQVQEVHHRAENVQQQLQHQQH
jgi:hypothetical protein